MNTTLPLAFDPALIEEAVLLAMRGHAAQSAFRDERDAVYLLPEERSADAFNEVHRRWFERFGLAGPLEAAVAELPLLGATCSRAVIVRAINRRDEGADLLVAPELSGAAARTVLIRVRPSSCLDAAALLAHLRVELLHVADMVDPDFGYQPRLPPAEDGPAYEQLVRDRYTILWQASVVGRLSRRGVATADASTQAHRGFTASFPMLGAATESVFEHFFTTWPLTHGEIAAFATDPRAFAPAAALVPGGRCPLCRFPTYAPEPKPTRLPPAIVTLIAADFPAWLPTHGLCRQCADLYRARPMSADAEQLLPGSHEV